MVSWWGWVEMIAALGLCVWLSVRFKGTWARVGIVALALAQLVPVIIWRLMFST